MGAKCNSSGLIIEIVIAAFIVMSSIFLFINTDLTGSKQPEKGMP